jgi:3-isopropylmalate dehydrogenase
MMLRYSFNEMKPANDIEQAVNAVIDDWFRTQDIYRNLPDEKLVNTKEITDIILEKI